MASVVIDGSVEHQTILGLGGQMESHYSYENDTEFWDIMFNQAGVSAIRIGSATLTIDNTNDPLNVEELYPVYRIARNYGLTEFAGGMAPKPEWKSPQITHGGTLLPEYYEIYSYYLVDAITALETVMGVTITMNIPFPEPSLTEQDPESPYLRTYMSATDYRDFLKVFGPIIRVNKPNVRIYIPCDWNTQGSISYANTILSDPQARQYVDGLASNGYGYLLGLTNAANWQLFANLAQQYNINRIWIPEQAHCDICSNPTADPAGLITAIWLHEALAIANAEIWQQWLLIDKGKYRVNSANMVGFVHSKYWPPGEYTTNGITKDGHSFRQFAYWIRPGAIRIDAISDDSNILASAYKHQTNNTLTMVIVNKGTITKSVNFTINNYNNISSVYAYRTSLTENSLDLGQLNLTGNTFTYSFPGESTTTFSTSGECPVPICTFIMNHLL